MRHPRSPSAQQGYTLFEQALVVAGIGAASAAALPNVVALQTRAEDTLLVSLASAAGSAMRLNQAGCAVTGQRPVPGKCQPIRACGQVLDLLQAPLPPGYRVQAGAEATPPAIGQQTACAVVRDGDGAQAAFAGLVAGAAVRR